MGWKIFDVIASFLLFAVLCGVIYFVIYGLQEKYVLVKFDDMTIIFTVATILSPITLAGIILLIRIIRRD